ncbi:hypothetical protein [Nocardia sp. NPDC057668]|uniref:hypothetical protein n=1 Tax=Nocardia sp. NPDC057668 TaxID=3346202 RepID=UPI00366A83BE
MVKRASLAAALAAVALTYGANTAAAAPVESPLPVADQSGSSGSASTGSLGILLPGNFGGPTGSAGLDLPIGFVAQLLTCRLPEALGLPLLSQCLIKD